MKWLLFSLLFTSFAFGQLATIHTCADTTELKNYQGSGIVLLDSYGNGSVNGGGLFHRIDSTYAEGSYAFDYAGLDGLQWARIGLIDPDPVLNSLTVTGATTLGTVTSGVSSSLRGSTLSLDSLVSVGIDSFATTSQTDTVVVSGLTVDDVIIIQPYGTTLDAQDTQFQISVLAGRFAVTRPASGASGLAYAWIRIKTH
jgi:hypothetical protein